MIIWVDAQFPPSIASWVSENFGIQATAVRELGLHGASDRQIFFEARQKEAVVMTKDNDFLKLLDELGAPPQVIWITCGNTSNARLREILDGTLLAALTLLQAGEDLVEIRGL